MKKLILLIVFLFSELLFSQASGSSNFSLHIDFEKNIPVDRLEVFCYTKAGNTLEFVNVKIDKANNSMSITGTNHFVIPVKFPTLYFSYIDKTELNGNSKQVIERKNSFYLVTGPGIESYSNNNGKKIRFSKELPNILITSKYEDKETSYRIEYFSADSNINRYFNENLEISNSALKLN